MTGHIRARLGAALVLAAICLGALAAPAVAATTTYRYVDDNTGPGRCHGTNFHTIQAAIDASDAMDVVYVCPGFTTFGNSEVPAEAGVGGAEIAGNNVTNAFNGLSINDNGHDIHDNVVNANFFGVNVYGIWNHIHDNNLTANRVLDCNDGSQGRTCGRSTTPPSRIRRVYARRPSRSGL